MAYYDQQYDDSVTNPFSGEQVDLTDWHAAQQGTYQPQVEPQRALMAAPQETDPYSRQAFQQAWQGSASHTPEALQQLIASDPRFAGIQVSGRQGDVVTLPGYTEAGTGIYRGPESLDVIGDVGGANSWAWSGLGGGSGAGASGNASQVANMGSGAGQFGGGGVGVDPELRAALLRLMGRSEPGAIDPNTDPNLQPQAAAYRRARERGAQQERAQAAERAAQQGLLAGGQGSGAFETQIQGIREGAGEDIAGYEAGLVGQEVNARRNDLMNALQLANAIGARDQAAQIQQKLTEMDSQYKYAALGQNQRQFDDQYGLNLAQFEQQANRDAWLNLLGGF